MIKQHEDLMTLVDHLSDEILRRDHPYDNSKLDLAEGSCGQMLFFAELAAKKGRKRDLDIVLGCLDKAASSLSRNHFNPGLFTGLSGIEWAMRYSARKVGEADYADDSCYDEIYEYIDAFLNVREYEFDLISGLSGIGLWALTLTNEARRQRIIDKVVAILSDSSEQCAVGRAWRTPPYRPGWSSSNSVVPEFNLGVAHGTPGVIGFLGECFRKNALKREGINLLRDSVAWLNDQRLSSNPSIFSDRADAIRPSRMAWCYGDPGIGLIMKHAEAAEEQMSGPGLCEYVIRNSAKRRLETAQLKDCGLCHGAAGVALIYHQMSRGRPEWSEVSEAVDFWTKTLLDMRKDELGMGGFYTWKYNVGNVSDGSWLTGAAGIGLALLTLAGGEDGWAYPLLAAR